MPWKPIKCDLRRILILNGILTLREMEIGVNWWLMELQDTLYTWYETIVLEILVNTKPSIIWRATRRILRRTRGSLSKKSSTLSKRLYFLDVLEKSTIWGRKLIPHLATGGLFLIHCQLHHQWEHQERYPTPAPFNPDWMTPQGLIKNKDGRCGAWSRLNCHAIKLHGIMAYEATIAGKPADGLSSYKTS